jgi:hypothetical protein
MKESIKLTITNSLATLIYYLGFTKNMLPVQILAWVCLSISISLVLSIVYSNKMYEITMNSLSNLPFRFKLMTYPFIAANIYFTQGITTVAGIVYLILVCFFEILFIIAKLAKNA